MDALQPYMPMIIQAVAGLLGGGVLGALLKGKGLGGIGNLIIGALGGVGAGYGVSAGGLSGDIAALVGGNGLAADGLVGFVGGGVLQAITGLFLGGKKAAKA